VDVLELEVTSIVVEVTGVVEVTSVEVADVWLMPLVVVVVVVVVIVVVVLEVIVEVPLETDEADVEEVNSWTGIVLGSWLAADGALKLIAITATSTTTTTLRRFGAMDFVQITSRAMSTH